jgi:hypothetical protein
LLRLTGKIKYSTKLCSTGTETAGTVTYRVVQVAASNATGEDVDSIQHIINPTGANFTTGTAAPGVQVLTSPINGQFYVIGSPQEVFSAASSTARSIAPRGQNDNVRSTTVRALEIPNSRF